MRFLIIAVSVAALVYVPVSQSHAGKREADLFRCQMALQKESTRQQQKEVTSYNKCLQAAQRDKLKLGLSNLSSHTVEKCKFELRKIQDSRQIGKSHEEKAKRSIMKACDPVNKAFTDEDVLEEMVANAEGLGGKLLADHCARNAGTEHLNTATALINCIAQATRKDSHNKVKSHTPKAAKTLKEVKEEIELLPPNPNDPTENDDVAQAAQEALDTIDPDGDGVPNSDIPFNPSARIAFVSSRTYTGNIGGAVAGQAECQDMASNVGLPGEYMVWLSDGAELAADELSSRTAKQGVPYVTPRGSPVAGQTSDFVNGSLIGAINADETGALVPDDTVWTASDSVGDNSIVNCGGFTIDDSGTNGLVGRTSLSDSGWTDDSEQACDQLGRLYCIEVDKPKVFACEATTGGFCWFAGATAQSCNDVCAAVNRTYDTATETYAGSGGTDANCTALGAAFSGATFAGTWDRGGIGCGYSVGNFVRRDTDPTTASATYGTHPGRFCACQ